MVLNLRLQLDLQFFAGEKTEKATPKKRQDVRKKGQVVKSQDVNTAFMFFLIFLVLFVTGGFLKSSFSQLIEKSFTDYIHLSVTKDSFFTVMTEIGLQITLVLAPIMIAAFIAGFVANLMQFGFLFTTEPLKFKLERIDPIKGAKRIFSLRAIVELFKSIFKISIIGAVTFTILWINKDEIFMLASKPLDGAIAFFSTMTIQMGLAASLALGIIAVFDYAYQKYDFEKQNRMSKQDLKDEHKSIEGDPLIKSKIKERQRMMAMQRMMSEVPNADVIITNPTHYAVAIKYDEEKADAPYIVAKGVDSVALKIREIAAANKVMTVENRPLARALYSKLEIGDMIGEEFFQAVAEILAYVYRVQKKN